MKKTAITSAPIAPVLADRWSPRSFEHDYVLSQHETLSILEAGRWAPSANNLQPWRFSVLVRGTELHTQMSTTGLSGFNQAWAPHASAIIVVSCLTHNADGTKLQWAHLDAGLAIQNILIQTHELGLASHVIGGIDRAVTHELLGLSSELEVLVAIAIGKQAPADQLQGPAHEREIAPRVRHDLDDIVLHGKP